MQMEQYMLRNHETRKYLQEQAYRLQQGIVTTTTQQAGAHTQTHTNTHIAVHWLRPDLCVKQMMDTMCVRVQDHLNSLRFSETSLVQEDMKVAENLMKDAKNSKTVGSSASLCGYPV